MYVLGYAAGISGLLLGLLGATIADHDVILRGCFLLVMGVFFIVAELK